MSEGIRAWLEKLGLSEYAYILGDLKEDHLVGLGVSLENHLRLLKAVATSADAMPTIPIAVSTTSIAPVAPSTPVDPVVLPLLQR